MTQPTDPSADRAARAKQYGQVLRRWGLLDEVNDPKAAEEFAVTDLLAIADAEQADLRRERDLAIAHDRQPYPTAWAYEQACKALHRKTEAIERVRSVLESEAVVGRSALDRRGLITSALMADDAPGPSGVADEAQQDEDPARIDRLRPEFFEHASVESIDVQIQRAQRQQRQWGNRVQTLTILRQARVMQKELGEWPAAVSQPSKEA